MAKISQKLFLYEKGGFVGGSLEVGVIKSVLEESMKTFFGLCLVMFVLSSCAPAAIPFTAQDGANLFTLQVNGTEIRSSGDTFSFTLSGYEMQIQILREYFRFDLVNKSSGTIKVLWDESAIVLPDGSSSRVLNGNATWSSRNDPQAPAVVPIGAKLSDALFPLNNSFFADSFDFEYMFNYPIESTTQITVLLTLEIDGQKQEETLTFIASPSREVF